MLIGVGLKALFVCNDKEEWNLLHKIFGSHFSKIELMCVLAGEDALEYLSYEGPFGLVLIDAAIKDEDPMQLAESVIDSSGERPIIFIGDEHVLKNRIRGDAYLESEIMDIFQKPYDIIRFKECIEKSLQWAKKEEFEQSIVEIERDEFLPLKLRNLYMFNKLPFDCYIELTRTKFIKAFAKDRPYTQSAIQDLARRNIKQVFLKKDEHLQFLENSMKRVMENLGRDLPPKKIIENQIVGSLVLQQFVKEVGIGEGIVELADKIILSVEENYNHQKEFLQFILEFPLIHGDSSERSILIFYVCEAICRGLGWRSDLSRKKLGLASLIHDSHLENEEMIRMQTLDHPDMDQYLPEEQENYKNHARKAAQVANQFSGYSDIEFIIEQHHELPDGSGFPAKLNLSRLTTVSCVFIIAHNFVNQLAAYGPSRASIFKTLNDLKGPYNLGNFKEPLQVLIKTFKL